MSLPWCTVRSILAAGGRPLNISYSARAVADALLSSTSRANSLRLLRSTCVFMQRLDGRRRRRCRTRSGRIPSWSRPTRAGPRWARASGRAAPSPSCPFSSSGVSCHAPDTGAGPAPSAVRRRSTGRGTRG